MSATTEEDREFHGPCLFRASLEDAQSQVRRLQARLALAEKLIEADNTYCDFDCPHKPEDRCLCGKTQGELSKACDAARVAYNAAQSAEKIGEEG